jgi:hypothetical protein
MAVKRKLVDLSIFVNLELSSIRRKQAQNIIKEIKRYQEKWLQHVQKMDTDYQNKHYSINQKYEET